VSKGRVLIVDDSPVCLRLASSTVQEMGYTVVECDSASCALMNLGKIDLVFMDICMPGMDGIEAVRQIRRLGLNMPIVMVSALVGESMEDLVESMNAGANDFISKPARPSKIRSKVITFLESK